MTNPNMKILKPYFLCLIILCSCSKNDSSNTIKEENEDVEELIADFDSDVQKIKINNSIKFKDLSKGKIISREWAFPGGDPAISTNESPVIVYKNTGIYDVSLKVKSTDDEVVEIKKGYIEVSKEQTSGTIPEDYVLRIDFDNSVVDKSENNNSIEPINFMYAADRFDVENASGAFSADSKSNIKIVHSNAISLDKELTIAFWFYYQEQQNNSFFTLIEKTNPADGGHSRYGMWLYNGGIVELCIEPDTCPQSLCQECLDTTQPLTANIWYHLVGTFDGNTLKIYIDGVEESSKSISNSGISQTQHELYIGTDPYSANQNFVTGRMDDLRLYNRALSNSEIQSLFNE